MLTAGRQSLHDDMTGGTTWPAQEHSCSILARRGEKQLGGASDSGIGTGGSRNIGGSGRTSRMPVPRSHIQTHKAHMSTHLHTCTQRFADTAGSGSCLFRLVSSRLISSRLVSHSVRCSRPVPSPSSPCLSTLCQSAHLGVAHLDRRAAAMQNMGPLASL